MRVRCDSVHAPGETYLLVAMPLDQGARFEREGERALEDLRRANRRLSGTLSIVLDTLDAEDLSALFARVLEEITETMEADGTIVYLAESDGFHLRGVSSSLLEERIARFMPFGRSVERVALREGSAVRLRVCAPTSDDLRQGKLSARDVVNEDTHEVLRMRSDMLPPFTSFMAVPVWFGGRVISIIEVGWRRLHPLPKDDARLLDSVAHYLSVQLAGTFTALRSQRADRLASLETELRERMLASVAGDEDDPFSRAASALETAADELEAAIVPLHQNDQQHVLLAELPLSGVSELPFDLGELCSPHERDGVAVVPVADGTELSAALRDMGEPCVGVLVDLGELADERRSLLMLRPDGAEPARRARARVRALARRRRPRHRPRRGGARAGQAHLAGAPDGHEERAAERPGHHRGGRLLLGDKGGLGGRGLLRPESICPGGAPASSWATSPARAWRRPRCRRPSRRRSAPTRGRASPRRAWCARSTSSSWGSPGSRRSRRCSWASSTSRRARCATARPGTRPQCSLMRAPAKISVLDVQSGVVGAFHDIAYQDGVTALEVGDALLLYTDGTTEARDPSGAFFGEEGLREAAMRESARREAL